MATAIGINKSPSACEFSHVRQSLGIGARSPFAVMARLASPQRARVPMRPTAAAGGTLHDARCGMTRPVSRHQAEAANCAKCGDALGDRHRD